MHDQSRATERAGSDRRRDHAVTHSAGAARRAKRIEGGGRQMSLNAEPARPPGGDYALEPALARALAEIVGEKHVLARQSQLLVYNSDGLPGYRRQPSLAVFPGTRDEVIAVVRALNDAGAPFVPRGAGTGLSGGALADGIVLLGLNRLKRIISIDTVNQLAVVEPGVVNTTLSREVAQHGLHYAPDPSSQAACTIGGNVAENAGGPHCLKYGVTLNHVLAVNAILPDGTLHSFGNAAGETTG